MLDNKKKNTESNSNSLRPKKKKETGNKSTSNFFSLRKMKNEKDLVKNNSTFDNSEINKNSEQKIPPKILKCLLVTSKNVHLKELIQKAELKEHPILPSHWLITNKNTNTILQFQEFEWPENSFDINRSSLKREYYIFVFNQNDRDSFERLKTQITECKHAAPEKATMLLVALNQNVTELDNTISEQEIKNYADSEMKLSTIFVNIATGKNVKEMFFRACGQYYSESEQKKKVNVPSDLNNNNDSPYKNSNYQTSPTELNKNHLPIDYCSAITDKLMYPAKGETRQKEIVAYAIQCVVKLSNDVLYIYFGLNRNLAEKEFEILRTNFETKIWDILGLLSISSSPKDVVDFFNDHILNSYSNWYNTKTNTSDAAKKIIDDVIIKRFDVNNLLSNDLETLSKAIQENKKSFTELDNRILKVLEQAEVISNKVNSSLKEPNISSLSITNKKQEDTTPRSNAIAKELVTFGTELLNFAKNDFLLSSELYNQCDFYLKFFKSLIESLSKVSDTDIRFQNAYHGLKEFIYKLLEAVLEEPTLKVKVMQSPYSNKNISLLDYYTKSIQSAKNSKNLDLDEQLCNVIKQISKTEYVDFTKLEEISELKI